MELRGLRLLALVFFSLGIWSIAVYASIGITGAVISETAGSRVISITGLAFMVIGLIILSLNEQYIYHDRESRLRDIIGHHKYDSLSKEDRKAANNTYRRHEELEGKRSAYETSREKSLENLDVIRTEHFERAVRNHNPELIQRAIEKIGTGKGKEEKLTNGSGYSVRVSKGGRIIFGKKGRKIELLDYLPNHEYTRK